LTPRQHNELLQIDRKNPDPELRSRAHLLLLAEGHPWVTIEDVLFCSRRTIDRWLKRFEPQGRGPGREEAGDDPFRFGLGWVAVLIVSEMIYINPYINQYIN
jgi:putative transposase